MNKKKNTRNISTTLLSCSLVALTFSFPEIANAQTSDAVWYSASKIAKTHCLNQYAVAIKTGGEGGAGTDSNISLELKGYKNRVLKTGKINSTFSGDIFEKNRTNTLYVCMNGGEKLGHIKEVTVRTDDRYAGSDWHLANIKITHPDNQVSTFNYNSWIEDDDKAYKKVCTNCVPASVKWDIFDVKIATSDDTGGGTDSNIFLSFINAQNSALRFKLNQLNDRGLFVTGRSDTFRVWANDKHGDVRTIKLGNDGRYPGSDWHVGEVTLTDKDGAKRIFEYNKWVNKSTAAPDLIAYPRVELVNGRPVRVQTESYHFDNLLNLPGNTKEVGLTVSALRSISVSQETGTTIGVESTVGYASGDAGGWEGSVTAGYERTSGKSLEDLSEFSQEMSETRTITIAPDTLYMAKCTWNSTYDVYDITGASAGLQPVGFITSAPVCAFGGASFPDKSKFMNKQTEQALRDFYTEPDTSDIIAQLRSKGVVFESDGSSASTGAGVGSKFQHTSNAALRGYNDRSFSKLTVEQCQTKCLEEEGFYCKSIDFDKRNGRCDLSKSDASGNLSLSTDYPGNPYDHYRRTSK